MSVVTADDLSDQLFNGGDRPIILDIRHPDEFEDWHIPESTHIDVYDELQDDPTAAREALDDVPTDREIVKVCEAWAVSDMATDFLNEMGYDAKTPVDGMNGLSCVQLAALINVDIDGQLLQVAWTGKGRSLIHI
jgi:rhodanese-related sulfurtransferase